MAVAKGAEIPKARLLDAVEATELARTRFELWATLDAPHLPAVAVDAMQVILARWQADRFANAPTSDVHMALGVIEELGESFDEDANAEDAVDALGDVMVYASQLCTRNRLAVGPVIQLAINYHKSNACHPQPICLAGMLAHIALKHDQQIRGLGPVEVYRPRLVDALALMIAKAIEECTIGHELAIDPEGVFIVIGTEVTARKAGDAMIPTSAPAPAAMTPEQHEQRQAAALERLQSGAEALGEAEKVEPGDFTVPTRTARDILHDRLDTSDESDPASAR